MRKIKTNSLGARLVSGLLSFVMVLTACPISAYADYDDDQNTLVITEELEVDEEGNLTIVTDEPIDENVDSIPENENAEDQVEPDVSTPPNIEDESTEAVETDDTVSDGDSQDTEVIDESTDDVEEDVTDETEAVTDEDVTDENVTDENVIDDEDTANKEDVTEETTEDPVEESVYTYTVVFPEDTTVIAGETLVITANVTATVTTGEETSDVQYTFEWIKSDDVVMETISDTSAEFTFNTDGDYTIEGKMLVDGEEVASDSIIVTVEEDLPVVVFDHYFSDIDPTLVETPDLMVTTADPSVFTKNTNVVSNFGDAYIISCGSVEEARYVYSYYVNKVDNITDLSKVISIATDENEEDVADLTDLNEGNDALSNLNEIEIENYAGYIALIDTGANADINFSVVGDDTSDSNGHGTIMYNLIKAENPNAKVMSIKVFNGSKTDAASVYAGIMLAIESKVSVINLSLVGSDVEKNAIVKEAIQMALDNDIVVIGAAGNYNLSATKFIPGCINDVIVIGAANEDGSKYATSNFDADYYVTSTSSSEATAIYTGLYTANKLDDIRISNGEGNNNISNPNDTASFIDAVYNDSGWDRNSVSYFINEDGTVTFFIDNDFELAGENPSDTTNMDVDITGNYHIPNGLSVQSTADSSGVAGTATTPYSGTATFTASTAGHGSVSGFSGNTLFTQVWNAMGSPALPCSCNRYWNEDNSKGAGVLQNGTVNYRAYITGIDYNVDNGAKTAITFDVFLADVNNTDFKVTWTPYAPSVTWSVSKEANNESAIAMLDVYVNVDGMYLTQNMQGERYWTSTKSKYGTFPDSQSSGWHDPVAQELTGRIKDRVSYELMNESDQFSGIRNYTVVVGNWPTVEGLRAAGNKSGTVSATYESTTEKQIYRSRLSAWHYNYVYLNVEKTSNASGKYTDILKSSSAYSLDGAILDVYSDSGCTTRVKDKDGNNVVLRVPDNNGNKSYDQTFTLMYNDYANKTLYVKERQTGYGYYYDDHVYSVKMPSTGGQTGYISVDNTPLYDPNTWAIAKIEDNTGKSNSNWSGDIEPVSAVYTVTHYKINDNGEKTNTVEHIWTYKTDENGMVRFDRPAYFVEATKGGNPPYVPGSTSNYTWPIGYYTIQETASYNGTIVNNQTFVFTNVPEQGRQTVETTRRLKAPNDREVMHKLPGEDPWVDSNYYITLPDGTRNVRGTDATGMVYHLEETVWVPMGLFKVDSNLVQAGFINNNTVISKPEGDGSYAGAQYQLFVASSKDSNFFAAGAVNQKNAGELSLGAAVNSVAWTDGLGNKGNTSVGTLYPVLYNGSPVIITTDANGIAKTNIVFPYADDYRFVEVIAPKGYHINSSVLTVQDDWMTDDQGKEIVDTSYINNTLQNTATVNGTRQGAAPDDIYTYGFTGVKEDPYNVIGQGSGSTNGIRFAVINRSAGHVVVNSADLTVDASSAQIVSGKEIMPGQVVAIVTTHTVNNVEGTFRMNGLPYGRYQIVELRHDATIAVGDAYDGSNKLGTSIYANPSYLWAANDTGIITMNSATQGYMYDLHEYQAYLGNDAEVEDDAYKAYNRPFVDGFQAYKLDVEYLQISEGDANLDDIRYAVVNTSARPVRLQSEYVNQADVDYIEYLDDTALEPGKVVAILTTHTGGPNNKDGYFNIYGLPYGTYTVYELRKDATIEVGEVYAGSTKLGSSIYANDSYYFDANVYSYDLTDTYGTGAEHGLSMAASFAKHHEDWAAADNEYTDNVFRDGFFFFKRDYTFNELDSHPQGDATFNDIRYAVVNRSEDPIKMFTRHNTVDAAYCQIVDGQIIQPGQVAAILTSHQKGNLEGYVAIMGLPYGNYDVYELRSDATIQVGDVYNGSNKLGSSIYANYATKSNIPGTNGYPSMLWNDTMFHYTLTDTGVHVSARYNTNEMHDTDDQNRGTWDNETVYGSIKITKYDRETSQTGVDGNQGLNTFEGIRFAVVNRSEWSVSYPYDDDSAEAVYEPGEVIDVVTLDATGEIILDHMCYGSYDVYELKMDSTIAPHDIYDTVKNDPAKFGTDHRANVWYCWNESVGNVKVTNRDLQIVEVDYIVTPQEGDTIRTQDEQNVHDYYDLPIRGDFETIKVDIDGKRMPYIPFLVSLVVADENGEPIRDADGNYQVIEEHIIVTNDKGEINTRDFISRPKSINNINQLDGLYDGVDFTGTYDQLIAGAGQNIWFGTPDEYVTIDQYLVHRRGSLLAGTYVLQELRLTEERFGADLSTEMYDMISSRIIITNDNEVVYPFDFDIGVDIPIYIKSEALDTLSKSDAFVPNVESNLQDTIEFGNLNSSQRYGFTTAVYRVKLDGSTELLYEDDAIIPIPFDTLLELSGGEMNGAKFNYDADTGAWTLASKIANSDPVFNVIHDFKVIKTSTIDTSMCEEGEYIAFTVDLYKAVGANGWAFLMNHNNTLDEVTQKIGVIGLQTQATNKTTETRVGSLGGYAYTDGDETKPLTNTNSLVYNKDGEIVGYTVVDDKVIYTNLADNHNYRLYAELVDDNGNTVKDIYGNDCALPYLIGLYSTEEVTEVTQGTNITDIHGNILERNLTVPRDGEFTFSDLGLMDWIIPNGTTVHVVVTLYDARGPVLKRHNALFDEEPENIRWVDIKTTAMSEEGELNILPNGKSWDENGKLVYETVTLRDRIDYTNLAEPIDIRVEGYVYLVEYNEDGTRNAELTGNSMVAHSSKVFHIADVNGSVEMQYTIDSGKYEGRDLVVCERVFMDVNGEEVLISLHEDINDENQTVSIPKIETSLVNTFDGNDYKVVSQRYADVTVNDTVTYTNVKPGMPWTITATLVDQATGAPVKDADGNNATAQVTFTPDKENGEVVVPITFKQVLVGLDWEYSPSWVCFEDLKPGQPGHTDVSYAVHNNINDEKQTVHLPTFRTTISSNNENRIKQILAAPDQLVTDTVEIKNIGLETILDEDGNITGYVPSTFTLEITAVDMETGEAILDSNGNPYVNTKVITIDGTKGEAKYVVNDGETDWTVVQFGTDENPIIETIDLTIDATDLGGKTIVFNETLYFGDTATPGAEVLVEDTFTHVEQMVTVPLIGTMAIDPETGDNTVVIKLTDTNGDGVIDENDTYDTNGDGVIDNRDVAHRAIIDTIEMTKITPNTEYEIITKLVDKETGKFVQSIYGEDFEIMTSYTSPATTPVSVSGNDLLCEHCGAIYAVNDEFTVNIDLTDAVDIEGKTLVVYEYMLLKGEAYASHEDINDDNQTILIPEIDTLFIDDTTGIHIVPLDTDAVVTETVGYTNLQGGVDYIMKCTLMDKDSKQPFRDVDGNIITQSVQFTAEEDGEGTLEIVFTLDKDLLHQFETVVDEDGDHVVDDVIENHGTHIVAYEECWMANQNTLVAIHADLEDTDQTILVPRIFTHLTDTVIGDHVSRYGTTETITDIVTYTSLQPGMTYTMSGKLINVDTNEPVLDADGKEITSSTTFTASEDGSGEVNITFTVDTTYLKGTHVVAFEDCFYEEIRVATHSAIDDEWQWTYIPKIGTVLLDKETEDKMTTYGTYVDIVDTVAYDKLLPGVYYQMNGILMDKETGEPILDEDGNEYTASTIFMPSTVSGEVDVVFTIDTDLLEGKTLVAFEECLYIGPDKEAEPNEEAVTEHKDIDDVDQTIYIPKVRTSAKDKADNNQALDGTKTSQTIVDTVEYTNLVAGKEYTIRTRLAIAGSEYVKDGETLYEYVKDSNGDILVVEKTFTPESEDGAETVDGSIDVEITFDASKYAGRKVVVFEDIYYEDVRVATHSDIKDTKQTLSISLLLHVSVAKRDAQNNSYFLEGAEITIYEDAACTRVAKDINGRDCIGVTGEDGNVDFIILTYDINTVLYAKETKAPRGYLINEDVFEVHPSANRESAGQCLIEIQILDMIIVIPPKTGDSLPILPIALFSLIGILCVGAFFALKPKKAVVEAEEADIANTDIVEEAEDSVVAMMTEDIDGGISDHSGFDT